jgi:hypothetical protein
MQDLTHWLPILVRGDVSDRERAFCASLIAQTRRGRRLSQKQADWLCRIRDAFQRRQIDQQDVVERVTDG